MAAHVSHSPTDLKGFKRQTCTVCSCEEKFNFHVPDELWRQVVPPPYQNRVVCLSCFDNFAREKNVAYSDALQDLYFAGDKATVKFEVGSAEDVQSR